MCPPPPVYVPQICVSSDHTSPPFASGVPLFLALAGAYLPYHIPQCQPCHVPASCCPQPLPSGRQPASAAPLPGAAPRCPVPGALPAATAYLSKWQQGQPALQPLPAGRGGRLWDHPRESVLSGATKEKRVQWERRPSLAEIQIEWPRGPAGIWGVPGLRVPELPNGKRVRWGWWEHTFPQYAEHERRTLHHLQTSGQSDFALVRGAQWEFKHAYKTDTLTLQAGQYTPLKRGSEPTKSI